MRLNSSEWCCSESHCSRPQYCYNFATIKLPTPSSSPAHTPAVPSLFHTSRFAVIIVEGKTLQAVLSNNIKDKEASGTTESDAGSGGGTAQQPQEQPTQAPSAVTGTAQPPAQPAAQTKRRQPGANRELELPSDFDGPQTATHWLDVCASDIGTATAVAARLDGIEAANAVKDGLNQNIEQLKTSMKELRGNISAGMADQEQWRTALQLRALLCANKNCGFWNA